jgi:hypothetical protein
MKRLSIRCHRLPDTRLALSPMLFSRTYRGQFGVAPRQERTIEWGVPETNLQIEFHPKCAAT